MKEDDKILLIVGLVIVYNLLICRGVNMECQICYKNGHHYHLGELNIHKNHGPKKNNNTMCNTCMTNKGGWHFHLC